MSWEHKYEQREWLHAGRTGDEELKKIATVLDELSTGGWELVAIDREDMPPDYDRTWIRTLWKRPIL